jgi:hypothetical protein
LQTGPLCGNAADPDVLADRRDRMAHSPRRGNIQRVDAIFDTLGDQEVQLILALTFDALKARGLPLPSSLPSSAVKNDIYNNTGFKQIACAGLPQKYDRSPDNLIPTLNLIHIR